jgi:hypothetical protein
MLNLLAAVVLTVSLEGGVVPQGCEPKLALLQRYADDFERAANVTRPGFTLSVSVEPKLVAGLDPNTLAWTQGRVQPHDAWVRVDFLCVASPIGIEYVVGHEVLHLLRPEFTDADIDRVQRTFSVAGAWEAFQAELEVVVGRMNEWRKARAPKGVRRAWWTP